MLSSDHLVSAFTLVQIERDLLCVALPGVMLKMVESDKTQSIVWHHISLQTLTVKLEIKVFLPPSPCSNHAVADRAVRFLDPKSD